MRHEGPRDRRADLLQQPEIALDRCWIRDRLQGIDEDRDRRDPHPRDQPLDGAVRKGVAPGERIEPGRRRDRRPEGIPHPGRWRLIHEIHQPLDLATRDHLVDRRPHGATEGLDLQSDREHTRRLDRSRLIRRPDHRITRRQPVECGPIHRGIGLTAGPPLDQLRHLLTQRDIGDGGLVPRPLLCL